MSGKKDLDFKEYSKKVTIICRFGVIFALIAIIASPMADLSFVFNNTRIPDTHIPENNRED